MAISYMKNEEELRRQREAELRREADEKQKEAETIESATAAALATYSDVQRRESQEKRAIDDAIAQIVSEQRQALAESRVVGAKKGTSQGSVSRNVEQIIQTKTGQAIMKKEDIKSDVSDEMRAEERDASRKAHERMKANMHRPAVLPSDSQKFWSRVMALGSGYMQGQALGGGGGTAPSTPTMPTNIPAGATGSSALTTTTQSGFTMMNPTYGIGAMTPNFSNPLLISTAGATTPYATMMPNVATNTGLTRGLGIMGYYEPPTALSGYYQRY